MPTMVRAINHGDDLVGINAMACQSLRDIPPQERFSTNDLKADIVM